MTTKQQEVRRTDQEQQARRQLNTAIGKRVLHALGQPGDLHQVQVRRLWENHYRVNVLTGGDATSARFANSFFLVADGDGNIVESNPKITRQY